MPFNVNDFQDLIRLLEQQPEWRAALRQQVLTSELLGLGAAWPQMLESQRHTEEALARVAIRLDELAGAQLRAEERLAGVEERLAGVEARQEQLEIRMGELAAALLALTERVERLVGWHQSLRSEVGSMSELYGAEAERRAERTLTDVLAADGYQLLAEPGPLAVDGVGEVDVVVPVQDPRGQRFWVLLESRSRLHRSDVRGWEHRLRDDQFLAHLKREGVEAPFLPYAFGLRVYPDADDQGRITGIGILGPRGVRVPAIPRTT